MFRICQHPLAHSWSGRTLQLTSIRVWNRLNTSARSLKEQSQHQVFWGGTSTSAHERPKPYAIWHLSFLAGICKFYLGSALRKLKMVQRKAARIVMNDFRTTSSVSDMIWKVTGNHCRSVKPNSCRVIMMYRIVYQLIEFLTQSWYQHKTFLHHTVQKYTLNGIVLWRKRWKRLNCSPILCCQCNSLGTWRLAIRDREITGLWCL